MNNDPIPAAIQALLSVFQDELASVKFPDVDAAVLASSADAVRACADAVARAEATLDEARVALAESHDALVLRAQRALAYARVYAEGSEVLSEQLEALTLPRAPRRAARDVEAMPSTQEPARRRGRPRKDEASGSLLDAPPKAEAVAQTA